MDMDISEAMVTHECHCRAIFNTLKATQIMVNQYAALVGAEICEIREELQRISDGFGVLYIHCKCHNRLDY